LNGTGQTNPHPFSEIITDELGCCFPGNTIQEIGLFLTILVLETPVNRNREFCARCLILPNDGDLRIFCESPN